MRSKSMQPGRRRFLKQLGMVTGAGTMLALGLQRKSASEGLMDANTGQSGHGRGYRLTDHIRSYYQKAGQ